MAASSARIADASCAAENPHDSSPGVQDQSHPVVLHEEGQVYAGEYQRAVRGHHQRLPTLGRECFCQALNHVNLIDLKAYSVTIKNTDIRIGMYGASNCIIMYV